MRFPDSEEKHNPSSARFILQETVGDPFVQIALEEAILRELDEAKTAPALRLWRCSPCVVLGATRRISEDVFTENLEADKVPLIRRSSGGGTVFHHPDNFCYSFYLPYSLTSLLPKSGVRESIELLCGIITKTLKKLGISSEISNRSDIIIARRKVSGTAQQRLRNAMCHHGTLLMHPHADEMARYLKIPAGCSIPHERFVTGLNELGLNLNMRMLGELIRESAEETLNLHFTESALTPAEIERALQLVKNRYSRKEWTNRFQ